MARRITTPVFVHGANQSAKEYPEGISFEDKSIRAWEEAIKLAPDILSCFNGQFNNEIEKYHSKKHPGKDFPEYEFSSASKHSTWYGDVWNDYCFNKIADGDGGYSYKEPRKGSLIDKHKLWDKLCTSKGKGAKKPSLLGKERGLIDKHFAELVPFYELYELAATGTTLYSEICESFLDDLNLITYKGNKDYILVAHSMGCAVSYNVMTHLSKIKNGKPPCNPQIENVLSKSYLEKILAFSESSATCLGLLTFGNYTGYNYAQLLNHHILFGGFKKQYPYPTGAVSHWRNFWTRFGSDLYILDDKLGKTITGPDKNRYKDVSIMTIPLKNIGHGRENWFKRNDFEDDMKDAMKEDLYFN